jgi:hypothetical protein
MTTDGTTVDTRTASTKLAFCGLYCGACPLFLATEAGTLEAEASRGVSAEQLRCLGCRSDEVSVYCLNCSMKKCASGQGLVSCADCADFPCRVLKAFDADGYPPHRGVVRSLRACAAGGIESWLRAQAGRFACRGCGRALSHQDRACPTCGRASAECGAWPERGEASGGAEPQAASATRSRSR